MTLPSPTTDEFGLLPPGVHCATLAEVEGTFVTAAPYRQERGLIWRSFTVWAECVWDLLPNAKLWLDGGFVTHKTWAAPHDIDAGIVARHGAVKRVYGELLPLLTLQDVTSREPSAHLDRVQPMSGHVDAFIVYENLPAVLAYWRDTWSQVRDKDKALVPDRQKGYVEVSRP